MGVTGRACRSQALIGRCGSREVDSSYAWLWSELRKTVGNIYGIRTSTTLEAFFRDEILAHHYSSSVPHVIAFFYDMSDYMIHPVKQFKWQRWCSVGAFSPGFVKPIVAVPRKSCERNEIIIAGYNCSKKCDKRAWFKWHFRIWFYMEDIKNEEKEHAVCDDVCNLYSYALTSLPAGVRPWSPRAFTQYEAIIWLRNVLNVTTDHGAWHHAANTFEKVVWMGTCDSLLVVFWLCFGRECGVAVGMCRGGVVWQVVWHL